MEVQTNEIEMPFMQKASIILPKTVNPFSFRNVEKAKAAMNINWQNSHEVSSPPPAEGDYPEFIYFKFNPQNLTTEQFQTIENDSTVRLMEIPFANMAIYSDDFALDEEKAEQLKDGSVYGVTPIENTAALSMLSSRPETQMIFLDTLVQLPELDTALQYQAFREAGASEEMLFRFRVCLFARPHGFVRYQDSELGFQPVRNIQVWSLFLGIPIYTYTRDDGYYEIPWRYSVGTVMGTLAKKRRVTIKPLDTHGTFLRNIYTLATQFVVGAVHIGGWVTPCQMKDGKDFNFTGHTQARYWSQLINAYDLHDEYCNTDGIAKAPSKMVCYAQWANTDNVDFQNVPDFGSASTPMLGHIPNNHATLFLQWLAGIFGGADITNYPNIFNLLTGLLPDMTFRVPQAAEPQFYNARLYQTAMHEISHASHYNRVGNDWWLAFIEKTIPDNSVPGNPYGEVGNYQYIELGESWAEFLGTFYAIKRYPGTTGRKQATNAIGAINFGEYYRLDNLIENEWWFFGGQWIPYGCYHDLMDVTTNTPNNSAENWDIIEGVTIQQLFNAHGNTIDDMCSYRANFIIQNPLLNTNLGVDEIFNRHMAFCR